ncbi:TNT domain-containing protein [Streptomonospora nanhaiensis]|uniref:TNT domain-containing protein n=1 Tax=Streptomonospora nanhaiensis TaxID=1323731 RepID=UPI001C9A168A|nr:TNT domain-containing protein [Streptomonospora nanhaiensis]MBX9388426.1 TNT domain-containing protein [Streptomonospora nanhaiensis]
MARDYDSQLLESVAVRRKRLREAVLFGPQRTRRRLDENVAKILIGLALSAVMCAGSIGWSFLQNQLASQEQAQREQDQAASPPPDVAAAPVPADWVGADVTMEMLRAELDRAEVPPGLYVLPGDPRPPAGTVDSYYLLTENERGFAAGIVEFEQGRTGAEFATEDEAARWLYSELVLVDAEPQTLSAAEELAADQRTAELTQQIQQQIREGSGDSVRHTLRADTVVDAFGNESGSLLFPDGMAFSERGLPEISRGGEPAAPTAAPSPSPADDLRPADPSPPAAASPSASPSTDPGDQAAAQNYHRYRVTHPFTVEASLSPGTDGHPGGGVRFTVDAGGFTQPPALPSIRWLLANGYLERVEVTDVPA